MTVGARGSPLSIVQVKSVLEPLEKLFPNLSFIFKPIKTSGDSPESVLGSGEGLKGLFVKEIEEALLTGEIDLAVHSAKDAPYRLPEGLALAAAPLRAPAGDALVSLKGYSLISLPLGSRVGTSSLRRRAQLAAYRPDLNICPVRGNVETRIEKTREEFLAVVLAQAALYRLGLPFQVGFEPIAPNVVLPAPGQGLLALELRAEDQFVQKLTAPLGHYQSDLALKAERAFMGRLGAGCAAPAAAWARFESDSFIMSALVASLDGRAVIKNRSKASKISPEAVEELGSRLAEDILSRGGEAIIKQCQNNPAS